MTITIAIILTLLYNTAAIVKNRGIPPSLSDSFYIFGGKPKGYVFYGYLAAMFCLLIMPMIDSTLENWQFLAFLSLAFLCFVGVAADFMQDSEKTVHFTCAIASAVTSLVWCTAVGHFTVALFSMITAGAIALINRKNKTWWLEMGCFAAVLITLVQLTIKN